MKSLSPARLLATPWTAAYQAPQSMGFSRQEYWSGKTKIMAFGPITSWEIDGETVADFILGGSKITADGDCSHEIKRRLRAWRLAGLSSALGFPLDLGARPLCRRLRGRGCANAKASRKQHPYPHPIRESFITWVALSLVQQVKAPSASRGHWPRR